jgi:hypothetical protein
LQLFHVEQLMLVVGTHFGFFLQHPKVWPVMVHVEQLMLVVRLQFDGFGTVCNF